MGNPLHGHAHRALFHPISEAQPRSANYRHRRSWRLCTLGRGELLLCILHRDRPLRSYKILTQSLVPGLLIPDLGKAHQFIVIVKVHDRIFQPGQ